MKLRKFTVVAAVCAAAAFSAALPVSAAFTEAPAVTTMPQLQAPAPTTGNVPAVTFNAPAPASTEASGGAVLGSSTQADSASTGDTGIVLAVAGLFVTAAIGTAAVAVKNRKK